MFWWYLRIIYFSLCFKNVFTTYFFGKYLGPLCPRKTPHPGVPGLVSTCHVKFPALSLADCKLPVNQWVASLCVVSAGSLFYFHLRREKELVWPSSRFQSDFYPQMDIYYKCQFQFCICAVFVANTFITSQLRGYLNFVWQKPNTLHLTFVSTKAAFKQFPRTWQKDIATFTDKKCSVLYLQHT